MMNKTKLMSIIQKTTEYSVQNKESRLMRMMGYHTTMNNKKKS